MAENSDSNVITIETFTLNFPEALSDDTVIKKYQEILNPLFRPFNDALKAANQEISALKVQMAEKDASITSLNRRIAAIESHSDDLEQQGRKGSVRVFGVPEETSGSTDDKILQICNDNLGLDPPLTLDDLEVTHRLGREEKKKEGDNVIPKPRPIIVKFTNRRVKGRVMDARSTLKDNPCEHSNGKSAPVYIQDDLTKRRANLAYMARQLKRSGAITDTWVSNCKVLAKDSYGRISLISSPLDLQKFEARTNSGHETDT